MYILPTNVRDIIEVVLARVDETIRPFIGYDLEYMANYFWTEIFDP